jgi:hypothetical protein
MSNFSIKPDSIEALYTNFDDSRIRLDQYSREVDQIRGGLDSALYMVAPILEALVLHISDEAVKCERLGTGLVRAAKEYKKAEEGILHNISPSVNRVGVAPGVGNGGNSGGSNGGNGGNSGNSGSNNGSSGGNGNDDNNGSTGGNNSGSDNGTGRDNIEMRTEPIPQTGGGSGNTGSAGGEQESDDEGSGNGSGSSSDDNGRLNGVPIVPVVPMTGENTDDGGQGANGGNGGNGGGSGGQQGGGSETPTTTTYPGGTQRNVPLNSNYKPGGSLTNADKIYKALIAAGYSPEAAAAIVGNLSAESGCSTAWAGDQGSVGIAQWRGERKAGLIAYAKELGKDPTDLDVQIQYLINKDMYNRLGADGVQKLKGMNDFVDATDYVCHKYESPARFPNKEAYLASKYGQAGENHINWNRFVWSDETKCFELDLQKRRDSAFYFIREFLGE